MKKKKRKLKLNKIYQGDCLQVLKTLPSESIDCCITSPPYWGLRDYGVEGQLGLEKTPEEYVAKMVRIYQEVKRVLKKEGTCWLNLGDSYAGSPAGNKGHIENELMKGKGDNYRDNLKIASQIKKDAFKENGLKPKDLVGIPWRVAFALQADGWWLRQDVIWHKPNPMPESVTDRCTKSHEYIFLLTKSAKYYYDNEAIKEKSNGEWNSAKGFSTEGQRKRQGSQQNYGKDENQSGRNKRSVWTITTKPYKEAHFATFPEKLIVPMVKAGCPKGGIVLDPFIGSGTTAVVARKQSRNYIGIELNPDYIKMAEKRLAQQMLF